MSGASSANKRDVLFLLALCLAVLFVDLGFGSLRHWDEGIYAACSREMYQRGDWLTLRLNGEDWVNKPPLYFWLTMICYKIVGINEWAVRLPSACCATLAILLSYFLGCKLLDRRVGLLAALILISTPHFLVYAKQGQLDVPLTAFTLGSLACFFAGLENYRWFYLSGFFTAGALMTKQVIGGFVPAIQLVFLLCARDKFTLKNKHWWLSHAFVVLLVLPWHWMEYHHFEQTSQAGGRYFVDTYLLHHVVGRVHSAVQTENTQWHVYLEVLASKARPWFFLFLPALGWLLWEAFRKRSRGALLVVSSVGVIVLVLQASTSKAHWYLLPLYPWMALGLALAAVSYWPRYFRQLLVFTCVIMVVVLMFTSKVFKRDFNPQIKQVAAQLEALAKDTDAVLLYDPVETDPALGFYWPHKVEIFRKTAPEALIDRVQAQGDNIEPDLYLITTRKHWSVLKTIDHGYLAGALVQVFEAPAEQDEDFFIVLRKGKR